jgi:NADPH2:quinone reductase
MKTVVHNRFGSPDVLEVQDVPKPVPRDGEVLIKVHATTVTTADCKMRRGEPLWGRVVIGLLRPRRRFRTLGLELAGEVESIGADVRRFAPGDQVFGFTGFKLGAHAQYKCLPEKASLALKPTTATYAEAAAAVDGPTTALFFLRDRAGVRAGRHVLVNGASGSIGTYAVQIAKHLGAEVTGVCGPDNVALVESLGADHVIDYSGHDFTKDANTYDVVFDAVGRSSFRRCRASLKDDGVYLSTDGLTNVLWSLWTSLRGGRRVVVGMSVDKREALDLVKELVEAGTLRVLVDRTFPLDEAAEAHGYVDRGHKKGNVVLVVAHPADDREG